MILRISRFALLVFNWYFHLSLVLKALLMRQMYIFESQFWQLFKSGLRDPAFFQSQAPGSLVKSWYLVAT